MPPRHSSSSDGPRGRNSSSRSKKVVRAKKQKRIPGRVKNIDYKDPKLLRRFVTERGKIVPRRVSGLCAKNQRKITQAIKRARMIALMPFTTINQ